MSCGGEFDAGSSVDGVEIWASGGFDFSDGARWVGGRLVFVDVRAGRLYEVWEGVGRRSCLEVARLKVTLAAAAPVRGARGHWIVATGPGIALLGPDGPPHWIARPGAGPGSATRMSGGCCDPAGRFWAASESRRNARGGGSLYRVDGDRRAHRVLSGLTTPGSAAFSPGGGVMYLADGLHGVIRRYRLDPQGEIADSGEFARLDEGLSPAGMTVDSDGNLWAAVQRMGGGAVHCYSREGQLLSRISLPTSHPTSVCLTPEAGRLFVTTARVGFVGESFPGGAILCIRVPAAAPSAHGFAPD